MSVPEWPRLYTPQEVSQILRIDPKTVTRWAKAGKIPASEVVFTLGGHRRIKASFIDALMRGDES